MSKYSKGAGISVYYDRDRRLKEKVETLRAEERILRSVGKHKEADAKAGEIACLCKHIEDCNCG